MAGTYIYMAPFAETDTAVLALAHWDSPEIEIPAQAHGFSVSFKSDVDGTLTMLKELGGVYQEFDSLPVTGGAVSMPVKVYNFRIPALKLTFVPNAGLAAVVSCTVDVTPNGTSF